MARAAVLVLIFVALLAALLLAWVGGDDPEILISSMFLMALGLELDTWLLPDEWLGQIRKYARGAYRFILYCRVGGAAAFVVALAAHWVVYTRESVWIRMLPWPAVLVACVLGAVVCARAAELRASRKLASLGIACLAMWGLAAALLFLGTAIRSEQPTFLLPTGSQAETVGGAARLVLIAGMAGSLWIMGASSMRNRRQLGAKTAESQESGETTGPQR